MVTPYRFYCFSHDLNPYEITTTDILCVADFPGSIKPAEPTYENGESACGKGTTQVTRF